MSIRTDAKPKYIRELASYITEKMEEVTDQTRTVSTQNVAILAALRIADELFQSKQNHTEFKREVQKKAKTIKHFLDKEAEYLKTETSR